METEEEVDILMSSDVYSATLSTKSITFSRAQTGWLFREDKTVGVDVIMMLLFPFHISFHRQRSESQGSTWPEEFQEFLVAWPRQTIW